VITAAIVSVLAGLGGLIFSAVPDIPVPDWLTDQSGVWGSLLSGAAALDQFVPVGLGVSVLGVLFVALAAGVLIRLVRMIISHVTGGGGAT
jgi:hypothetical protein